MASREKYVFLFEEGRKENKALLGGKGANLAEMALIGLPIPPGFTISTRACNYYLSGKGRQPAALKKEIEKALSSVESKTGRKFGDKANPLLVSVRSGAPVSMPGMMDTILNLGLNDHTLEGLISQGGNRRFALDSYRRLIQMFGNVVKGVPEEKFEAILSEAKKKRGVKSDVDLDEKDLEKIIEKFKAVYKASTKSAFPQDPKQQLSLAIGAVFDSWNTKRAITYRKIHRIPDSVGTAANVQAMVFGNMGNDSGTGVGFTRNPSTGEKKLYGEYLINAQGEDVVAGIRTPKPLDGMKKEIPLIYKKIAKIAKKLELHYADMQDFEFTFEKGKLWMLQTRNGKRTAEAAVRLAVDMHNEGILSKREAIMRIEPEHLDMLLHKRIDPKSKPEAVGKGLPASPGAAFGQVVFSADRAEILAKSGMKVLLVRPETTPEDIHGVVAAEGVLTTHGGLTSHAAVVARGMGKPCVSGCEKIKIDLKEKRFTVLHHTIKEGDWITIDGLSGEVMLGKANLIDPEMSKSMRTILRWADRIRSLGVRANADTPEDAKRARDFGAEGIGLCRTEHMFMQQERLPVVREMIMAADDKERRKALAKLLPMQRSDFLGIFKAMNSLPVVIRLLDPPLHEFLPDRLELTKTICELEAVGAKGKKLDDLKKLYKKASDLSEKNPMLGFRGCRLGILYPEIYEMQVQAIFEAACEAEKQGFKVFPNVMIPLVGHESEIGQLSVLVSGIAERTMERARKKIAFKVGTMIELPRACLIAEKIANHVSFFSFGTNDLTQTTLGISRDDAEVLFLEHYVDQGVIQDNPFMVLDSEGVGKLIKMAVEDGRKNNKKLSVGICGEHGGDPRSIAFCQGAGIDYVSCSPFRVPIARLAAAQAAISKKSRQNPQPV
jgi:pyruvate,orthophosphate dikinase